MKKVAEKRAESTRTRTVEALSVEASEGQPSPRSDRRPSSRTEVAASLKRRLGEQHGRAVEAHQRMGDDVYDVAYRDRFAREVVCSADLTRHGLELAAATFRRLVFDYESVDPTRVLSSPTIRQACSKHDLLAAVSGRAFADAEQAVFLLEGLAESLSLALEHWARLADASGCEAYEAAGTEEEGAHEKGG